MDGSAQAHQCKLSPEAQQRIVSMAAVADCEVDADGTVFAGLHNAYLIGASSVLRELISEFRNESRIPLKGDNPGEVALMLSLIYDPQHRSLNEANVHAALRMAAKYGMADIRNACETFLCNVVLTVSNLPRWLALSIKHDVCGSEERCFAFAAADDNFEAITRHHSNAWMYELPGWAVVRLIMPQYQLHSRALSAIAKSLDRHLERSAHPVVKAQFSDGIAFYRDHERKKSTRLDRATMQAVMYGIALQCDQLLSGDTPLRPDALQRVLPAAMPHLPLPPRR